MPSEAWGKRAKRTVPRGMVNMADRVGEGGRGVLDGEGEEGQAGDGEEVVLGESTSGRRIKASARLMASN